MSRKFAVVIVIVIVVLAVGVSAAAAQQYGRGAGQCPTGVCQPQQTGTGNQYGQPDNAGNAGAPGFNQRGPFAGLPPQADVELSAAAIDTMTAGLLDEYQAWAVYQAVINQFGAVNPFVNIQRAEAQHIAAWETLFERYGVALPAAPAVPDLTFASLADACQTAAAAEIANFGLYDTMLNTLANYPDMIQVVTALRDASQYHHLPAFEQCAG